MSAIIIIPYTVTMGPPEDMPVTRDADIPNQLLAEFKLAGFVDFGVVGNSRVSKSKAYYVELEIEY